MSGPQGENDRGHNGEEAFKQGVLQGKEVTEDPENNV